MLKRMLKQIAEYKEPKKETMAEFLKRIKINEKSENDDGLTTLREVEEENDWDRMVNDKIRNGAEIKDGWVKIDENGYYIKLD